MKRKKKLLRIVLDFRTIVLFFALSFCLSFITTNVLWFNNILSNFRTAQPIFFYAILLVCPLSIAIISYFIGQYFFYRLNVEDIVHYLENFEDEVNHWKFKHFVKDIDEVIIPVQIDEEYMIYGVSFDKTARDEKERRKFIEIINNERVKKITYVCVYENEGYIEQNVEEFLKHIDQATFNKMIKTIDGKEEDERTKIFIRKSYYIHKAIITIIDGNLLFYQLAYNDTRDEDFNSQAEKLAIVIENKEVIRRIKGDIRATIHRSKKIDLKHLWKIIREPK